MALAVGEDQSRVWSLDLIEQGQILEFRHAHTLKDGSPDPVTGYGGFAEAPLSTENRAVFPVDAKSKQVFQDNGLEASMTNVWTMSLEPGKTLTYELTREGRKFTAVFDLENPLPGDE